MDDMDGGVQILICEVVTALQKIQGVDVQKFQLREFTKTLETLEKQQKGLLSEPEVQPE